MSEIIGHIFQILVFIAVAIGLVVSFFYKIFGNNNDSGGGHSPVSSSVNERPFVNFDDPRIEIRGMRNSGSTWYIKIGVTGSSYSTDLVLRSIPISGVSAVGGVSFRYSAQ